MRIVSGTARGRKLVTPEGEETRPSSERLREALFGSIQFELVGARILDLFAGSGALSMEALSRGAASALCNDKQRCCTNCILENAQNLGFADKVNLLQMDYQHCLAQLTTQGDCFDYIFIDPPYTAGLYDAALQGIAAGKLLAPNGSIFVEHDNHWTVEEKRLHQWGLHMQSDRTYGKAKLKRICWAQESNPTK